MADNDAMQVDTHATTSSTLQLPDEHENPQVIIDVMLLQLRDALHTFIIVQITRTLGEAMVATFAPPRGATEIALLNFIDKKWISIFADSPLSAHKHVVLTLLKLVKSLMLPTCPADTHAEIARCVEALLMCIAPTLAAKVADLRRAISPPNAHAFPSRLQYQQQQQIHAASHSVMTTLNTPMAGPPAGSSTTDAVQLPMGAAALHLGVLPTYGGKDTLPMAIVLDGSNIAWRHGRSSYFSMRGALLALRFYSERVRDVALFLPEARMEKQHRDADSASYDEIAALQGSRYLVLTPSSDYDDAYICAFARKHAAAIVSNDEFRDHVYQARADGERFAKEWKHWLQACRISFTFCEDEFVPYPAFNWAKACNVASQLKIP